jgi:hypothetical protein
VNEQSVEYGRTFASFADFVRHFVLPLHQAHPQWRRLDGWESGGNRTVAARFAHRGRAWKVHADTHFERVLRAFDALAAEPDNDPFVIATTARAGADKLVLRPELRPTNSRFAHLYIYADG